MRTDLAIADEMRIEWHNILPWNNLQKHIESRRLACSTHDEPQWQPLGSPCPRGRSAA
jgi:hypothetical protein